ncbi:hypothetical protein BC940DRAFT_336944 [Gongronella butleri]|nr:hypothetical protein BC940DRAFT_336944 [Gongronella butleri]
MEHYRKAEQPADPAAAPPAADNEVRITMAKSVTQLVDQGLKKLETHGSVVIVSKGKAINRGITVVEIIKRRKDGKLHQYNQMGIVTTSEQWTPAKDDELDTIVVDTKLPITVIHLSVEQNKALELTSGYQAPSV